MKCKSLLRGNKNLVFKGIEGGMYVLRWNEVKVGVIGRSEGIRG